MTCAKLGCNDDTFEFQRRPSNGQGGNKVEKMSSNSWTNTDSPNLPPRNKPQKTENQNTKTSSKIATKTSFSNWSLRNLFRIFF